MSRKVFYKLENLYKYGKNTCIIEVKLKSTNIYNYDDIIEEARKCVAEFAEFGIEKGSGIALDFELKHSAGICILLLSILQHDCRFCPLNNKNVKEQASKFQANFLISQNEQPNYELFKSFKVLEEQFNIYKLNTKLMDREDIIYSICTSGSTGAAKIVHVPFQCIAPNIEALSEILETNEKDVIAFCTPLTFDPSIVEFFLAFYNGAALHIIAGEIGFGQARYVQALTSDPGATILQMTPSKFRISGIVLTTNISLRALILGGEEFPQRISTEFSKQRIFNIYGITEVSCWSTIYEVPGQNYSRIPLGQPLDTQTALQIVEPGTNNVLTGCCEGELQIVSHTRKCLISNEVGNFEMNSHMSTGDLVERNAKDEIFYIGRLNNVIKRFGKRICLDELSKRMERIIAENLSQLMQCVCIWQHTKLIACFSGCDNDNTWEKIHLVLRQFLDTHEIPDLYERVDQMPLNAHNKINVHKLKEILLEKSRRELKTPLSIFTKFLQNTLSLKFSMYELENINDEKRIKTMLDISFSAAGGTSFQALSLATEIQELVPAEKHTQLMEMLLSGQETLKNILLYLQKVPIITTTQNKCRIPSKNVLEMKQIWRADLKRCVDSSPTGVNDYVCVGSHAKMLLTVDALTGRELSRLQLTNRIECSAIFVTINKHCYGVIGDYDGLLYIFDFKNGAVLWHINVGGMIKARPLYLPTEQTVIVASYASDYNLMCICLETKRIIWKLRLGEKGIYAAPLLLQNSTSCIVCTLDGTVARLKVCNSSIEWDLHLETPIFSTPNEIMEGNRSSILIIAEVSGKVHFCQANNGKHLNLWTAGGNIFSSIQVHQMDKNISYILFGCHDTFVYCLKYVIKPVENELELYWKFRMDSPVFAAPVVFFLDSADFNVLICSTKGQIVIVSLTAGIFQSSFKLAGEIFSTPLFFKNNFYIGCRDNFLYGLSIE